MKWKTYIGCLCLGGIITFVYFSLLPKKFETQIEIIPGNIISEKFIEDTNLLNIQSKDSNLNKFIIDNNLSNRDIIISKKNNIYVIKINSSSESILNKYIIFFEKFLRENVNTIEIKKINDLSFENNENKKILSTINSIKSESLLENALSSVIKKDLIKQINYSDNLANNSYFSYISEDSKKIIMVKQDYLKITHFFILTSLILAFLYSVFFKTDFK